MTKRAAALGVALLVALPAAAAETTVFRCVEPGGRVLYTDSPCRNADVIEINPGKADPAAARRLAEAQAKLDAGMERLRADEARESADRAAFAQARAAALAAQPPEPAPVADYWPVYGGFVGPIRPRPPHAFPPKHTRPPHARPPGGAKALRPPRPEPLPR